MFSIPNFILQPVRALSQKGPFICDLCGLKPSTRASLQSHMYKHKNIARLLCDMCPKSFDLKHILLNHLIRDHLKLFPFECKICDYKTSTRQALKSHMRQHGPKTKCNDCNKMVLNLNHHLRTHAKATCHICGKEVSKSGLRMHMTRMHE